MRIIMKPIAKANSRLNSVCHLAHGGSEKRVTGFFLLYTTGFIWEYIDFIIPFSAKMSNDRHKKEPRKIAAPNYVDVL